jgi:ABC-type lipoprotein export system ATPase subunit
MKPNYKKLAKEYREKWQAAEEKIGFLRQAIAILKRATAKQDLEIDKLEKKYSDAMNTIIDLQESILMKEEKGDA